MKILFLSHHWSNNSHHSKYSGFQRLVVEAAKSNDVTLVTWAAMAGTSTDETGITVVTVKAKRRDYLFQKRMRISSKGFQLSPEFDVVHALYSDCTYHLPKHRFTVTFHVLPEVVSYSSIRQKLFIQLKYRLLQKRAIRRSANIACVSRNLLDAIPPGAKSKASFIPHGIDTDFWDPALVREKVSEFSQPYLLIVGSHGLDHHVLQDFILENPGQLFVLVGVPHNFANHSNVVRLTGVTDERLRDLYHHAEAVVKPVVFATANNSILEALAMGKTIITSRVSGISDYLDDTTCIFIDTLTGRKLTDLREVKLDPNHLRDCAVERFSWRVVLEQYVQLYHRQSQHSK